LEYAEKMNPRQLPTNESGVEAFQESYSDRFTPVSDPFQKQEWNIGAARNNAKRRHGGLKFLITLGTFLSVSVATLILHNSLHIACAWLAAMAIVVAVDGFRLFERFLALPSRVIIAAIATMIAVCLEFPGRDIATLTVIVIILGIAMVKTLNTKWLGAEIWMISDTAQAAMHADADNEACRAWQADGKRSTRWMLAQMNLPCNDDALDVIHRAVWLAGWLAADKRLRAREGTLERIKSQAMSYQSTAKRLQAELEDVKNELAQYKDAETHNNSDNSMLTWQLNQLRTRVEEQDAWLNKLREENEQLRQGVYAEQASLDERGKALLIAKYMKSGDSQNEAGRKLGLAQSSTYRLIKKARENGWIE